MSLPDVAGPYLYRRIEEELRILIAGDTLRPGDRLPSETDLARQFATTRVTVAKAMDKLAREGVVKRYIGRGSFVAPPPVVTVRADTRLCESFEEQMALTGHPVQYRLVAFSRMQAPEDARRNLGLAAGSEVYRLDRVRLVDGHPMGVEERYLPLALAGSITAPMLADRSALDFVSELIGYHVPVIAVTLYPDQADAVLARRLRVEPGSPVTVREHVYRDRNGGALLFGRNVFGPNVRLTYELGPGGPQGGHAGR